MSDTPRSEPVLLVDDDAGVRTLTFNRPEALNAFNQELWYAAADALEDAAADDQARVMTPEKARLAGSDYIVVGRPITASGDPAAAYRRCVNEFEGENA